MSLFKLNDQGDLDRGDDGRGFTRVNGVEEARVHLKTRVSVVRGEVRRSANTGIDLYWAIQPDTPDQHVANHINSVCVGTPGVVDSVLKYNFEAETGVFDVQAKVQYNADNQRERRTEHESFLLQAPALTGGVGGPIA